MMTARNAASALAEKAAWSHFIEYYYKTYDIALRKITPKSPKGDFGE